MAIKRRRAALGLTQAQVAELSGLAAARISEIERNVGTLTLTELSRLGSALAFDPSAALRGDESEFIGAARQVARFKARQGGSLAPLDVRLFARAAELSRIGAFLWERLSRPERAIVSAREVKAVRAADDRVFREGYALGKAARYRLAALPREPLSSVQHTLEGCGVQVAFVRLETAGVSAISLFEPGGLPVVLLNEAEGRVSDPVTRRSILAHELCHLLHDGSKKTNLVMEVSRSAADDGLEKRANAFAPSFLAPGEWVGSLRGGARAKVIELATSWGMTFGGAAWHAKNLRLISDTEAQAFQSQPVQLNHSFEVEPDVVRLDSSLVDVEAPSPLARGLVADLAIEAAEAGIISTGRAREILHFR